MKVFNLFEHVGDGCTWACDLFLGSFAQLSDAEDAILRISEKRPTITEYDFTIEETTVGELKEVAFGEP